MEKEPRVVIGLPVYNGENYLRESIESILAQTYSDFRLLISDNASTDATPDICQEYVKQDSRVVYYRQPKNIGGAPNYNFLFQPGDAPYFRWQAHDDVIGPDFLKHCVALLDANPTMAIAHTRSLVINENGSCLGTNDHEIRLNGKRPSDRFWRILWAGYFTEVFGLMRSAMVRRTAMQGSFAGSDRNFMAEMLLQGDVGYVEEYLFSRRDHPDCYCRLEDTASKMQWFDPTLNRDLWKLTGYVKAKVYLSAIQRLPIPFSEKLGCIKMLAEWTLRRGIESATGMGERFGDRFRQEHAAERQYCKEGV